MAEATMFDPRGTKGAIRFVFVFAICVSISAFFFSLSLVSVGDVGADWFHLVPQQTTGEELGTVGGHLPEELKEDSDVAATRSAYADSSSKKKKTAKLLDFFKTLCEKNKPYKCCRKETDIAFLDEITMTLGAVQVNDIHSNEPPPDPLDVPDYVKSAEVNCAADASSRYQFQPKGGKRQPIFSGPADNPRVIIDVTLISFELNMLEARLYQLNEVVDYFVVVESGYTHRGWKKPRWLYDELQKKEKSRFVHFLDKIIYLDADEYPQYMARVNEERSGGRAKSVDKDVWNIQTEMRKSVWPLLKKKTVELPDEALMIMADMDWFPCLNDLRHLRQCAPSPEYGWKTPFHVTMVYRHEYTLWNNAPVKPGNEKFAIHTMARIRELDRMPRNRMDTDLVSKLSLTVPNFVCGTHMQLMGSLANLLYRDMTHAEGGIILLGDSRLIEGKTSFCEVDDSEFLKSQQHRISQHAEYFNWRLIKKGKVPRFIPREGFQTEADEPSPQILEQLRKETVPWPFLEHRERYPFYWGKGTFDMYSAM